MQAGHAMPTRTTASKQATHLVDILLVLRGKLRNGILHLCHGLRLPRRACKRVRNHSLKCHVAWHYNMHCSSHNAPTACNCWQRYHTLRHTQALARHTRSEERLCKVPTQATAMGGKGSQEQSMAHWHRSLQMACRCVLGAQPSQAPYKCHHPAVGAPPRSSSHRSAAFKPGSTASIVRDVNA